MMGWANTVATHVGARAGALEGMQHRAQTGVREQAPTDTDKNQRVNQIHAAQGTGLGGGSTLLLGPILPSTSA